jgi:hypothetical protein
MRTSFGQSGLGPGALSDYAEVSQKVTKETKV